MTRPVFGIDRDAEARGSWATDHDADLDDEGDCEVHGDNREACRRFNAEYAESERRTDEMADALLRDPLFRAAS